MSEIEVMQRLDDQGREHDISPAVCERCGCPFEFAMDDPTLTWEPRYDRRPDCLELPLCGCHLKRQSS